MQATTPGTGNEFLFGKNFVSFPRSRVGTHTRVGIKSFQTLNFKDNVTDLIGLKSFTAGFSALMGGHKPGAMKGSPLQLGGAVIITPDNRIAYYFQSKFAGNHPPIAELLDAVSEL